MTSSTLSVVPYLSIIQPFLIQCLSVLEFCNGEHGDMIAQDNQKEQKKSHTSASYLINEFPEVLISFHLF